MIYKLILLSFLSINLTVFATSYATPELSDLVLKADHILVSKIYKVDMVDGSGEQVTDPEAKTGPGGENRIRIHLEVKTAKFIKTNESNEPKEIVVELDHFQHLTLGGVKSLEETKTYLFLLQGKDYQSVYPYYFKRDIKDITSIKSFLAESLLETSESKLMNQEDLNLTEKETKQLKEILKNPAYNYRGELNYSNLKMLSIWCRAQSLIGSPVLALKELNSIQNKVNNIDQHVIHNIDRDKFLSESDKKKLISTVQLNSLVKFTKGIIYFHEIIKAKKAQKEEEVKKLLLSKTGAAVQFYICATKHKGSRDAIKAKEYYKNIRLLVKKWLNKKMKPIEN